MMIQSYSDSSATVAPSMADRSQDLRRALDPRPTGHQRDPRPHVVGDDGGEGRFALEHIAETAIALDSELFVLARRSEIAVDQQNPLGAGLAEGRRDIASHGARAFAGDGARHENDTLTRGFAIGLEPLHDPVVRRVHPNDGFDRSTNHLDWSRLQTGGRTLSGPSTWIGGRRAGIGVCVRFSNLQPWPS